MKILSVAEDNLYSLWQLELQIYYYKKLGLQEYFVPIVVGKQKEPNALVKALSQYKQKIYYYPMEHFDFFANPDYYAPALQPYGAYRYLTEYPMHDERYVLIDVDVLFKSKEDFYNLYSLDKRFIYSSPSDYIRSDYYTHQDPAYIKAFDDMFNVLKINKSEIDMYEAKYFANKKTNPGGHTFVLSNINPLLFLKIAKDSIDLYQVLKVQPEQVKTKMAWMASIWSYYYNMLKYAGKSLEYTPLLNFCWATDSAQCNFPIYHMTGVLKERNPNNLFCKLDFLKTSPFSPENYEKVNSYNVLSISYVYANLIREYWNFNPVCILKSKPVVE